LKDLALSCLLVLCVSINATAFLSPKSGFFLADSVQEVSFKFKTSNNLILIPVTVNDSVHLNLILDTGCRNIVLFGKRFEKLFGNPSRAVAFSGIGNGKPCYGNVSINNKVSLFEIEGHGIPIIVVPNKKIFDTITEADGVIGYELFIEFEVQIDFVNQMITLRSGSKAILSEDYNALPIELVDSRPVLKSIIVTDRDVRCELDLIIDTGSSLGILIKTTDMKRFKYRVSEKPIAYGINGLAYGYETVAKKLEFNQFNISNVPTGIIEGSRDGASIGMEVLKNYVLILNYSKSYVGLKKV
jgi:hypothetical protein